MQEQLEEQTQELKRSVRERQELEIERTALQKQARKDAEEREEREQRLVKCQTEQAVACCELEACKKQVLSGVPPVVFLTSNSFISAAWMPTMTINKPSRNSLR